MMKVKQNQHSQSKRNLDSYSAAVPKSNQSYQQSHNHDIISNAKPKYKQQNEVNIKMNNERKNTQMQYSQSYNMMEETDQQMNSKRLSTESQIIYDHLNQQQQNMQNHIKSVDLFYQQFENEVQHILKDYGHHKKRQSMQVKKQQILQSSQQSNIQQHIKQQPQSLRSSASGTISSQNKQKSPQKTPKRQQKLQSSGNLSTHKKSNCNNNDLNIYGMVDQAMPEQDKRCSFQKPIHRHTQSHQIQPQSKSKGNYYNLENQENIQDSDDGEFSVSTNPYLMPNNKSQSRLEQQPLKPRGHSNSVYQDGSTKAGQVDQYQSTPTQQKTKILDQKVKQGQNQYQDQAYQIKNTSIQQHKMLNQNSNFFHSGYQEIHSFIKENENMIENEIQSMKNKHPSRQHNHSMIELPYQSNQNKSVVNPTINIKALNPINITEISVASTTLNSNDYVSKSSKHQKLFQLALQKQKQQRQRDLQNEILDKECYFHPQINKNSSLILEKRKQSMGSNQSYSPPTHKHKVDVSVEKDLSVKRVNKNLNSQLKTRNSSNHTKIKSSRSNKRDISNHDTSNQDIGSQRTSKKQTELLVIRKIQRQIGQVISHIQESLGIKDIINQQGLHNIFYYLGTFSSKFDSYDLLNQNRRKQELAFIEDLWNLVLPVHQQQSYDVIADQSESKIGIQIEILQKLLMILYCPLNKNKALEDLTYFIPEIRINCIQRIDTSQLDTYSLYLDPDYLINQARLKLKNQSLIDSKNQKEIDEQSNCTFTPQINLKSIEMDHRRFITCETNYRSTTDQQYSTGTNIRTILCFIENDDNRSGMKREELLQIQGKIQQEKIKKMKELMDLREMSQHTFKPQIIDKSRELARESKYGIDTRNSINGLDQQFSSRRGQKSPSLQQYLESKNKECTFRPQSSLGRNQNQISTKNSQSVKKIKGFEDAIRKNRDKSIDAKNYNSVIDKKRSFSRKSSARNFNASLNQSTISNQSSKQPPSFIDREIKKKQHLFVLSLTLSNKKQYQVKVPKNVNPSKIADLFCYENGLSEDVKLELKELLTKCLVEYKQQSDFNKYISQN
ncbi:UNKNOWN [Stylonychia lemnae]|uniref:Uncharacterized protein n=1 Tax=Stylonychia lemnae TaxID=5949 RepID=A0A078A6S9_STYLE|nr:UNKNOWN [Stylonychia lemnae]|eukprot:CDW77591.1 UNKNOWN [Stylonychia lemnae]